MEALLIFLVLGLWVFVKVSLSDLRNTFEKEAKTFEKGILLFQQRMFSEAITFFENTGKDQEDKLTRYLYLAKCHKALKNFHQAYWNYTRVLNRENYHASIFKERGEVLLELEEWDLALLDFDKAIWFDRENPEAYFQRGCLRLKLKMKKGAKDDFSKAKAMGHENANFYLLQPILFSDLV